MDRTLETGDSESRKLLRRLKETLAESSAGQARLDRITQLIASSMQTEVCSVYLFRDSETLELCATEGLKPEAVHQTRMRLGEGLVGRVARDGRVVNEADAPSARGFRYMPETGEEVFSSFCGVPIQRLGEVMGVLVVQNQTRRNYTEDEVEALEIVDRKKIEVMRKSKTSMMPKGLLNTLSREELLDLMAYLLSRGDRNSAMFKK